jgi:hypothetical protein
MSRVAHASFDLVVDAQVTARTVTISMQRLDMGRALLLWVGAGAGPASLGALAAAAPVGAARAALLDAVDGGGADGADAGGFAAALSRRAGKLVLLAWSVDERAGLDGAAELEVQRRALDFVVA